jgi:3-hydroxyisobutyrate dehydrogenase
MPTLEPGKTRIGWIGTGVMGVSMCGHLLKKGYSATVYNRSPGKAGPLMNAGATWADSPQAVAANSDVIFAMVGFPRDVREVFLGSSGILAGCQAGRIVIDMTTSEPALAQEIFQIAKAKGVDSLDAPVSGGDLGAKNASLSIMVGGENEALATVRPLLECLGKTIVHQGPAGSGQHTKMVNQILIATTMIGVCEALLYTQRSGLNVETVLQSVSGGAAGSKSLELYGNRILSRNFEPGFYVEHFLKDMEIALAECKRMALHLPGLELAQRLYSRVRELGFGHKGTHALMLAIEEMNRSSIS